MPFLYVYSPKDFIKGLPDEVGGAADGKGPWELMLAEDARPTLVEIKDDDGIFDEVDYSQSLASAVKIDGAGYEAGTTIHSAYDLTNSETGHQVTSLHFGGSGYEQGAVHGLVSSVPLKPGEVYKFDRERTSHRQKNFYKNFTACFAAGTRILTPGGEVEVERLVPGDRVIPRDRGIQTLRWCGMREVSGLGALAPVAFAPGSIGNRRRLRVSPQHRMLIEGARAELYFGAPAVLVAAKHLVNGRDIAPSPCTHVSYCHLAVDGHAIVYAEGAASESFLPSRLALAGLAPAAREEFLRLFPGFRHAAEPWPAAAPCLRRQEARLLA